VNDVFVYSELRRNVPGRRAEVRLELVLSIETDAGRYTPWLWICDSSNSNISTRTHTSLHMQWCRAASLHNKEHDFKHPPVTCRCCWSLMWR